MDIDAVIAEAETLPATPEAVQTAETKPEAEATTEAPETKAEPEGSETESAPEEKPKDEVAFPKKALNAISYRDKKIGKLEAKYQQAQAELDALKTRSNPGKPEANDAPKEADFTTYGEYLRAEARFAAKQELNETKVQQLTENAKQAAQDWEAERQSAIDDNHQEAIKAFPDFADLVAKSVNAEGKIPLSPDARKVLLEADNGAFALRQILKDGLLSDLNELSPAKAAMLVARMEDKSLAESKQKPTSKAPAPMTPAKGNSGGMGKAEDELVDDILSYVRK